MTSLLTCSASCRCLPQFLVWSFLVLRRHRRLVLIDRVGRLRPLHPSSIQNKNRVNFSPSVSSQAVLDSQMAPHPLQPSEYEIQMEVEALKDLRRRSTNPGALTIDPDLPNQSSPVSPTPAYRPNRAFTLPAESLTDSRIGSTSNAVSESNRGNDALDIHADDPSHLFWVPASVHPEIAPAEFRAFLKEHARTPPADDNATFSRSASFSSSSSLNRKKSMLSRQYKPKETDGDEEENIIPIKRNRSIYHHEGPQLTINDLQVLEELAEAASQSDDPSKLRNVLRRSISLNMSPTGLFLLILLFHPCSWTSASAILLDEIIDMDDDADSPIVVPSRDKALKRTARTKIRKVGLPGDGGGHRFASSRRGKKVTETTAAEARTSSDLSTSDHGDSEPISDVRRRTTHSEEASIRPDSSYSEEQFIFDAYATQEDDEPTFSSIQPLEPFTVAVDQTPKPVIEELLPPVEPEPPIPVLHHPQPQRLTVPQSLPEQGLPSRTPSPADSSSHTIHVSAHQASPPPLASKTSPPPTSKKEKDKKGLFKWGDKSSKKAQKEKDRNSEKEPSFLSSLFSRKKQDAEYQSSITGGTSGREAAQALLGASKSSKSHAPSPSPGLAPGIGGNPYARYPLHVERAIYRLSHIKLANPRRPLYEQVLISNLMFWYLGVINKSQNPAGLQTENTQSTEKQEADKEEQDLQRREKEKREKAEKERLEKERLEKERELEMKKREPVKRGSLTKSPPGTPPVGGRRAEMPVKGPQYDMQHRVMEQEYGNYSMQQPRSPTSLANSGSPGRHPLQPATAGQPMSFQAMPSQHMIGQPVHIGPVPPNRQMASRVTPMQQVPSQPVPYDGPDNYHPQQRPGLPPGAMPPMENQGWMSQTNFSSPPRRAPSPNPQGHSPPTANKQLFRKQNISQEKLSDQNGSYRTPVRSLSVTATPGPPQPNGAGHFVSPGGYPKRPRTADSLASEEEDVPLAVWQQRRR